MSVPFNRPYATGKETGYINDAIALGNVSGNGPYSARCEQWLERRTGCAKALLANSCTAALEMAAMLIETLPGDEIIMPSYAFVSTANAFAMHGAVPVFVDIRPDTLNIDETQIEAAITPKTKAIVMLHYAGIACEIDTILAIARKHKLYVIEDNAHGILAEYKDKPLGSFGHLATLSFHETKNITCGQGGALLINDEKLIEPAYVIRDKGTNRHVFEQGKTPFYTWVGKGSNYALSEIHAAFLWAQLEAADSIARMRMQSWMRYKEAFDRLESTAVKRPTVSESVRHNGHISCLILPNQELRDGLIAHLSRQRIGANFHYVPLHLSPAYRKINPRTDIALPVTEQANGGLVRLPLWIGIESYQEEVIQRVLEWIRLKSL